MIVKGVGQTQRPPAPLVLSTFFGLHYFRGGREAKPRVAEAHACLITPPGYALSPSLADGMVPTYEKADADSWVLCTFAALRRRCMRNGLFSGTTQFIE